MVSQGSLHRHDAVISIKKRGYSLRKRGLGDKEGADTRKELFSAFFLMVLAVEAVCVRELTNERPSNRLPVPKKVIL